MAAMMASTSASASSLSSCALLSTRDVVRRSTPHSLKAVPALPGLRRSRVAYGVPGAVKDQRVARGPSALFGGEFTVHIASQFSASMMFLDI
jgi:hypothetical protein